MSKKPWAGRFTQPTDAFVEAFTASIDFDQRLYRYDIQGSIAHARMLARQGIIAETEARTIISGLESILDDIEQERFEFSVALEDIHMNIEARLIERIGPVGGKLHTARSRNDQVALDIRLYLRDEVKEVRSYLEQVQESLLEQAERNLGVIMPGYTHLQTAQPILFSHHMLAYYEMFRRDSWRMADMFKRINLLPLGAGALAGTTFPIDREFVAEQLGFDGVTRNSLDSVSDRDFALEFCSAASIVMMHLSRLAEELILWSSADFHFIDLSDAFCTGSSIMPQKKNPDVPELVRGKTGRVYGNLISLLTVMKALPLAYNKDMQEDKEPLFDTVDTLKVCLDVYTRMFAHIDIHKDRMRAACMTGFLNATDFADYLVNKGVAFRTAHGIAGKAVSFALGQGKELDDLTLEELQSFNDLIEKDIYNFISLDAMVARRNSYGGTGFDNVSAAVDAAKKELGI